jgi:hypothetical protein
MVAPSDASVAQLVEQRIENPRVGGSNPPRGTIFLPKIYNQLICPHRHTITYRNEMQSIVAGLADSLFAAHECAP